MGYNYTLRNALPHAGEAGAAFLVFPTFLFPVPVVLAM